LAPSTSPLFALFCSFSWQELRQHPWRNAAAVVSVMLGVALAFSVHLINASALDEFAQAVRSVGGQPDLELRAGSAAGRGVDTALLARMAHHPDVALANPVLEFSTTALSSMATLGSTGNDTSRVPLRIVGVDVLQVAFMAPDLMPIPSSGADRLAIFGPDTVFLNPAARKRLPGETLQMQVGLQLRAARVAGSVRAAGNPLAVMDIATAQDLFDKQGQITRVDIRLRAGVDRADFVRQMQAATDWPEGARLAEPGDTQQRMNALSRAYRVNLTVLALVALFTGGFLVFSVIALSVSRRAQQFALLGVLGMTGAQRMRLVLLEAGALGLLGSVLGIGLGTGLAGLALRLLGGDLGGGFFSGATPALQWSPAAACVFVALGVAAACMGAWWPARWAQRMPAAQTLKGVGTLQASPHSVWLGAALLALGGLLALLPPVFGIPLAAYASVGFILLGGIVGLPWLVGAILDQVAPLVARRALPLLAVERARRVRESAAVAVSGVVASLSLAVALTVMVASFRTSVTQWLDSVLPAALYVRTAASGSALETAYFEPAFVLAAAKLPGVERLSSQRSQQWFPDPTSPPVTLIARPLPDPGHNLPMVGEVLVAPPGSIAIYVSEAMVDLYGARPGTLYSPLNEHFRVLAPVDSARAASFFVAGVWRDYSRQFGTIALEQAEFEQLSGDRRVNDLAFWLNASADPQAVQQALRDLANRQASTPGGDAARLLEFGSASEIRATSLRIFDRSFAVTYWLQAVAIGIGLFGVAASFSAQVLARRKEFGLLVHLGLTRRQVLQVVAFEGAAWTTLGAIAGIALGLAVAVVLVRIVNPQSFHWTMDLTLPTLRLLALGGAVVLAGTLTAWVAGRAAAGRDAVLAVKEDW
jgi:putative ABC transport system permease protein